MPDEKAYELVDGQLVERNMGAESSEVGGNLYFQLRLFCRERDSGKSGRLTTAFNASRTPPAWSGGPTSHSSGTAIARRPLAEGLDQEPARPGRGGRLAQRLGRGTRGEARRLPQSRRTPGLGDLSRAARRESSASTAHPPSWRRTASSPARSHPRLPLPPARDPASGARRPGSRPPARTARLGLIGPARRPIGPVVQSIRST